MSVDGLPPGSAAAYAALLARASADPGVRGLVVSGSHARGLAGPHSDVDVFVVVDGRSGPWQATTRTRDLDTIVLTVAELADTSVLWNRYAYRGAVVVLDRLDGGIAELVRAQATPTAAEVDGWLREDALDSYLNFVYRAAKSRRDGRFDAARLDEWESVGYFLTSLFALHGRLRPYNKYLRWELETYPLGPPWTVELLLGELGVRPAAGYRVLVALARERGYGDIVDAWGDELTVVS